MAVSTSRMRTIGHEPLDGEPDQPDLSVTVAITSLRPSPARLDARASRKHDQGRHDRHPPLLQQVLEAAGGHGAELGRGCRGAEPEERQGGQGEDQVADVEAGGHHDGGDGAGQQVAEGPPEAAGAGQARRLEVRSGRQGADLAAHDAGVERPPHDGHRDQGVELARAEGGHHGDGQHRSGQGQEEVGDPHQHGVDPPADGAGHQADRRRRSPRPRSPPAPRPTRLVRRPNRTRLKMSKPTSSVPRRWPPVSGGVKGRPGRGDRVVGGEQRGEDPGQDQHGQQPQADLLHAFFGDAGNV